MTIPFGGRLLMLTLRIVKATVPERSPAVALGATDRELVRLGRRDERRDFDLARWSVLSLIYGGERRP